MYLLVLATAAFVDTPDPVLFGWKFALVGSAIAASIGTAGGLLLLMGLPHHNYHLFARLEFLGFGGIVTFEVIHGMYSLYLAITTGDLSLIARSAAHVALAVSVGLSYRSRPMRERSYPRGS